jgi:hypothetical protein
MPIKSVIITEIFGQASTIDIWMIWNPRFRWRCWKWQFCTGEFGSSFRANSRFVVPAIRRILAIRTQAAKPTADIELPVV